MSADRDLMRRALELAATPSRVTPNPRVGAVLVKDGVVIGEGAHQGAGYPHAESEALDGVDAEDCDLYVTLEPCVHEGRTPPCVPRIVRARVKRVICASLDPDPRVNGAGFDELRAGGIEVISGLLSADERHLNFAYHHQRRTGRPLLTVKLALSLDGRTAASDGSSQWITGPESRARVHRRRAEVDAIVVGAGTVIADDPSLTSRDAAGSPVDIQPAAIVVDSGGRTPATARLFEADRPVLMATTAGCPHEVQTRWKEAGGEVVVFDGTAEIDLIALMDHLANKEWLEIYCEAGARLATALIQAQLADRLELYYAPKVLGSTGAAIGDLGIGSVGSALEFTDVLVERCGNDFVVVAAVQKERR